MLYDKKGKGGWFSRKGDLIHNTDRHRSAGLRGHAGGLYAGQLTVHREAFTVSPTKFTRQGKLISRKGFNVPSTTFKIKDVGERGRSRRPAGSPAMLKTGRLNRLVQHYYPNKTYTELTNKEIESFVKRAVMDGRVKERSLLGMLNSQIARRKYARTGKRAMDKEKFRHGSASLKLVAKVNRKDLNKISVYLYNIDYPDWERDFIKAGGNKEMAEHVWEKWKLIHNDDFLAEFGNLDNKNQRIVARMFNNMIKSGKYASLQAKTPKLRFVKVKGVLPYNARFAFETKEHYKVYAGKIPLGSFDKDTVNMLKESMKKTNPITAKVKKKFTDFYITRIHYNPYRIESHTRVPYNQKKAVALFNREKEKLKKLKDVTGEVSLGRITQGKIEGSEIKQKGIKLYKKRSKDRQIIGAKQRKLIRFVKVKGKKSSDVTFEFEKKPHYKVYIEKVFLGHYMPSEIKRLKELYSEVKYSSIPKIRKSQLENERKLLKSIKQFDGYPTYRIFSISSMNALERLKDKGLIKFDKNKHGYVAIKHRGK